MLASIRTRPEEQSLSRLLARGIVTDSDGTDDCLLNLQMIACLI